jgi:hypothetical protein
MVAKIRLMGLMLILVLAYMAIASPLSAFVLRDYKGKEPLFWVEGKSGVLDQSFIMPGAVEIQRGLFDFWLFKGSEELSYRAPAVFPAKEVVRELWAALALKGFSPGSEWEWQTFADKSKGPAMFVAEKVLVGLKGHGRIVIFLRYAKRLAEASREATDPSLSVYCIYDRWNSECMCTGHADVFCNKKK